MFYVYLVKCSDNSLYCGYTNDLDKRIKAHNSGLGAKYTTTRKPVKLVYSEKFDNKSQALKREFEIKQLTRPQKLQLINHAGIV
ncbi:MAG: GIY-YIG nuclease family protein [Candidatus Doudnabacteria bacterium]